MTCVFGIRVRMCVDLLFYCIQPNLRAMNGDLRLHACHTNIVLCSHSETEALVIDPEQLRWLEVS